LLEAAGPRRVEATTHDAGRIGTAPLPWSGHSPLSITSCAGGLPLAVPVIEQQSDDILRVTATPGRPQLSAVAQAERITTDRGHPATLHEPHRARDEKVVGSIPAGGSPNTEVNGTRGVVRLSTRLQRSADDVRNDIIAPLRRSEAGLAASAATSMAPTGNRRR